MIPQGAFLDEAGNPFAGLDQDSWSFTTEEVFKAKILSLALVNADTDSILMEITEGLQINLMDLPTMNLNIVAFTDKGPEGSVLFDLNGVIAVENHPPYAIGGDANGNFKPWMLPVGEHTLTVTPYSEYTSYGARVGNGQAGTGLTIHFSVIGYGIQSFVLVNADTDQDLQILKNGDVIDLSSLPTANVNIRAVTNPQRVGRVMFNLNGTIIRENHFPYAIGGDLNGDFRPWTLPIGNHLLQATPYNRMGEGDEKGLALQVAFSVIETKSLGRADFSFDDSHVQLTASPNPFHESTLITFSLPQTLPARLDLLDMKGVIIHTLFEVTAQAATPYQVKLESKDLPSGVYILRLSSQKEVKHSKLILTR